MAGTKIVAPVLLKKVCGWVRIEGGKRRRRTLLKRRRGRGGGTQKTDNGTGGLGVARRRGKREE